jgi:hypothetical protein
LEAPPSRRHGERRCRKHGLDQESQRHCSATQGPGTDSIDKLGDLIDDTTGGQYVGHVDQAKDNLSSQVDNSNASSEV